MSQFDQKARIKGGVTHHRAGWLMVWLRLQTQTALNRFFSDLLTHSAHTDNSVQEERYQEDLCSVAGGS
ncbi:hypothetical protein PAMP_005595 [Pampus punctatissimus]